MYALKQLVGLMAMPTSIVLALCAVALLFFWRRRPRAARASLAIAAVLLYLSSTPAFAELLLWPLEARHPALHSLPVDAPNYIVVLGSAYRPRDDVPISAALDVDGLARIVEGVRLWRQSPAASLILTGGAPVGRARAARGYEALARELGVDAQHLRVLDQPLDTAAESRAVAAAVGSQRFVLVTSASHMPRAMRLMQDRGLDAIAAPTAHQVDRSRKFGPRDLLPRAAALRQTETAMHELVGLAALAAGVGQ